VGCELPRGGGKPSKNLVVGRLQYPGNEGLKGSKYRVQGVNREKGEPCFTWGLGTGGCFSIQWPGKKKLEKKGIRKNVLYFECHPVTGFNRLNYQNHLKNYGR